MAINGTFRGKWIRLATLARQRKSVRDGEYPYDIAVKACSNGVTTSDRRKLNSMSEFDVITVLDEFMEYDETPCGVLSLASRNYQGLDLRPLEDLRKSELEENLREDIGTRNLGRVWEIFSERALRDCKKEGRVMTALLAELCRNAAWMEATYGPMSQRARKEEEGHSRGATGNGWRAFELSEAFEEAMERFSKWVRSASLEQIKPLLGPRLTGVWPFVAAASGTVGEDKACYEIGSVASPLTLWALYHNEQVESEMFHKTLGLALFHHAPSGELFGDDNASSGAENLFVEIRKNGFQFSEEELQRVKSRTVGHGAMARRNTLASSFNSLCAVAGIREMVADKDVRKVLTRFRGGDATTRLHYAVLGNLTGKEWADAAHDLVEGTKTAQDEAGWILENTSAESLTGVTREDLLPMASHKSAQIRQAAIHLMARVATTADRTHTTATGIKS